MYSQWTALLKLDYFYAKVKSEIAELAIHVRSSIEHDSNQKIVLITNMGLPLSVVIAVWTIWLAVYGEEKVPDLFFDVTHLHINPWQQLLIGFFVIFGVISLWQIGIFICRYVVHWVRRSRT